jgi:hypothetical protein
VDVSLAKHYTRLFEKRHKGDYNDFFGHDEETVRQLYPKSVKFIETLKGLVE